MKNNYDDIINLPYLKSSYKTPMSLEQRSAQFAPFAALNGYEEAIDETGRLTNKKIELSETEKIILDSKIQIINDNINIEPLIEVVYFINDKYKKGGKYITKIGNIRRININENVLIFKDKTKIDMNDILDIKSSLIKNYY